MKVSGAALAAALLITGPVYAQTMGGSSSDSSQDSLGTMGTPSEGSQGGMDSGAGQSQGSQDVIPAPSQSPDAMTGGTQENVIPEPGAAEDSSSQGGAMDSQGSSTLPPSSQGEYGTPSDSGGSGSSMGNESGSNQSGVSESAVPSGTESVTGTIRKMDAKKGMITLKTESGKTMSFKADTSMMQGEEFKKGTKVTAQYTKSGRTKTITSMTPAGSPGASDTMEKK